MADKLKQEVAENALAVQAGRDVNVGMSFTSNPQLSSSASFLRLNVLSSLN